jgi:cytochrome c oxidase subunit 2
MAAPQPVAVGAAQDALVTAGPHAGLIADLWWLFFTVCAVVFAAVVAALAIAVARGARARRRDGESPLVDEPPSRARRIALAIALSVAVSALTVLALLVASVLTGRALAEVPSEDALSVAIVGHRWWWEITYQDPNPSTLVMTANELHVPVGRSVVLQLESRDVIHSLWIPSLNGKRDLIPGHQTFLTLRADRPGAYRAQCAEFCGAQHANMALWVIAEPPEAFASWLAAQRRPAAAITDATDERVRRGRDVFMAGPCPMCHTVGGTDALGSTGPSLTHLASRATLAAGTLPRTPGHLGAWILDPQTAKPGSAMPPTALTAEELDALVAYLESLR